MRIVLFCESLINRAGIERMTVELAKLLSEDNKIYIVTIEKFNSVSSPYAVPDNIPVVSLNTKFGKSFKNFNFLNISTIRRFRKFCKEIQPDYVITVATPLIRISAPALLNLNIKNIGWEHFNLHAGSKIGSLYKLLSTWMVNKTVVLTQKDAADFKKFLSPGIICIPNFTSIGENEYSPIDNKVLLAVGRHSYQKGFDLLLKAWALSKPVGWTLRIVGNGELKSQNIKLAKSLGIAESVEFKDSTSDISAEFLSSSCFVLSSRFEGLVLVLIEAKMMGLPSICFDCPNSPREVIQNNIDGWLVKPESVSDLADMISLRLSGEMSYLKKAGRAARNDALQRYSKIAVGSSWRSLLKS